MKNLTNAEINVVSGAAICDTAIYIKNTTAVAGHEYQASVSFIGASLTNGMRINLIKEMFTFNKDMNTLTLKPGFKFDFFPGCRDEPSLDELCKK